FCFSWRVSMTIPPADAFLTRSANCRSAEAVIDVAGYSLISSRRVWAVACVAMQAPASMAAAIAQRWAERLESCICVSPCAVYPPVGFSTEAGPRVPGGNTDCCGSFRLYAGLLDNVAPLLRLVALELRQLLGR